MLYSELNSELFGECGEKVDLRESDNVRYLDISSIKSKAKVHHSLLISRCLRKLNL
jgi:hypothetical protein